MELLDDVSFVAESIARSEDSRKRRIDTVKIGSACVIWKSI